MASYGYEYDVQPEVSSSSSEEEELIKQTFESMGSQVPFQGAPVETVYVTPSYTAPVIETIPVAVAPEYVHPVPLVAENVPSVVGDMPAKASKKKIRKEKKWTTYSTGIPIEYESESESLPTYARKPRSEQTEITNWSGPIPLNEYPVNQDDNPEVVTKKTEETLQYKQEISLRYLRPPSPLPHGDIIIQHEKNFVPPPAPPVVIRQQPPVPETPPPLVIREAAPKPLPRLETKVITLPGKKVPPPPRKVIIERLPQLPPKPQPLVVERWLPFKYAKRRVVYNKPEAVPVFEKPKNVIIQWETPNVVVNREFRDLGVVRTNPDEYMSRYGSQVKRPEELPDFVRAVRPPEGLVLAADVRETPKVLIEGDLEALSLVDLDKEGLSELKSLVPKQRVVASEVPQETYTAPKQSYLVPEQSYSYSIPHQYAEIPVYSVTKETIPVESYTTKKDVVEEKKTEQPSFEAVATKLKSPEPLVSTTAPVIMSSHAYLSSLVENVLDSLVLKNDDVINFYEAKEFIKLLNERLNKSYSNAKAERFLESIRLNRETANMDLEAFKRAVMRNLEFYSIFMF